MKRTNSKLIYTKSGAKLHFYYSDKDGLCLSEGGVNKVLIKEAHNDFDVCLLDSVIYLICQNTDGDIILLKYFDEKWHKYTLLVSKTKGVYDKNFYFLITGHCLQLFYTIKSVERLLLVEQIICDEISSPIVIAPIAQSKRGFFAVCDNALNTYIYYQSEQGGFGYKVYKWSSKSLGDFVCISEESARCIHALIDEYGRHHICCMCKNGIIYLQRDLDGKYLKESHVPYSYSTQDSNAYIRLVDEKIYIIWSSNYNVIYSVSIDDAKSFSSPTRIISSGDAPTLFTLQNDHHRTFALGTFSYDDIRFINVGSHTNNALQKPSAYENKKMIKKDVQKNDDTSEINRIKSAISALSSEVCELKNKLELVISLIDEKNMH